MGMTLCNTHGLADIALPCPHAAKELENKRYGKFSKVQLFLICADCLHKYELERFVDNDVWEEDEEVFEAYLNATEKIEHSTPWCCECVAVVEVEQARREGRDDPFPVYEKTLNSHSMDVINELQTQLTKRFKFEEPIVEDNHLAVFVWPGTYTRPLTLQIYYVTSENKQSHIVEFVNEFFQDLRENQVKVQFLEAEVWDTWSNAETGVSGAKRGDEKLLREVFLNC
jgi:hypothetical protein